MFIRVMGKKQHRPKTEGRQEVSHRNGEMIQSSHREQEGAVASSSSGRSSIITEEKCRNLSSCLAVFGDSGWSLALSFVLLLVAMAVSWKLDSLSSSNSDDPYSKLGPVPAIDPPFIFDLSAASAPQDETTKAMLVTDEIRSAYARDGVVAVRGLIDADLLDRVEPESRHIVQVQQEKNHGRKRTGTQFYTVNHSVIFRDPPDPDQKNATPSAFLELALMSSVPQFAAQLLGLDSGTDADHNASLRVIRDIFLAKDDDQYNCGWHVDDMGFWPATPSSPGVNAWIALDDMPLEHGGGFALAVGSHLAPWRQEAYHVTGASTSFPEEGYQSAADLFARRTGYGTCNLKKTAPHLDRRMEETKRVYPVRKGDVIFHERWLFHRTITFDKTFAAHYNSENDDELVYRRYSIRYGPGSSVIPPGYGTELSVLWNEANGGRTADQVSRLDGPWYPQAWPSVDDKEVSSLFELVGDKIPMAEERRAARKKEMQPFLKKLARKNIPAPNR